MRRRILLAVLVGAGGAAAQQRPAARRAGCARLIHPLPGAPVSSGFGMRTMEELGEHFHAGIDFAAPIGTPIRAAAAGRIESAGPNGNYGLLIEVDHGGGVSTRYGHLWRLAPRLRAGQMVQAGSVIGQVGNSGRSTGPHLHFEVRLADRPVNPGTYLSGFCLPPGAGLWGGGRGSMPGWTVVPPPRDGRPLFILPPRRSAPLPPVRNAPQR